ncbi:fungal-specific transcription factor domain-containing protein [Kalaharituber pfeilii]|nr:fungal-specific transcription factor domain-containing protein [Kalaharituber pfeilii]
MPGILPMKLIKCGNSQTRIAQACDRCRSKKIRCDGIRPCCSQCSSVGFECKTSDKLSRRAFPRGYTESLEERVRQLEAEVKELKQLLDAKDEQLEMLSRIHSFSPYSPSSGTSSGPQSRAAAGLARSSPVIETPSSSGCREEQEEGFIMQESAFLVTDETGSFYLGGSSGLPFVDFFRKTLRDRGFLKEDFDITAFFTSQNLGHAGHPYPLVQSGYHAPSRLSSDHLVTSFFQEYHPLFPIIHRPSFLKQYEKLISCCETSTAPNDILPNYSLAQLYLVFAIAARNSEVHDAQEVELFDLQWRQALNSLLLDTSIEAVQCLVLAQLYCFTLGDYHRLAQYKALCVGMALRIGLNRMQKDSNSNAIVKELRKRAFWCVYCLDSFSAALLGLPRLLKEEDISVEYPSDIDDEYITHDCYLSVLPGDFTKISSAIALFRGARVLANVLDSVYPTAMAHEQTFRRLRELEDELDTWKAELAPHLRLEFVNGVPATKVVHSRSPLLVLAYHYIRILIHRPVVRSTEGTLSSASFLSMAESSKHIVQIIQLFSERKLGFSFCLNKNHLLVVSGFAILYGTVNYQQKGPLVKESEKLISGVIHELEKSGYERVKAFRKIAETIVHIEKLVTKDLGTVSVNSAQGLYTALPTSPTISHNQESRQLKKISSLSAKFSLHKDLSLSSQNNLRRANSQIISSSMGQISQNTTARRNTLVGPLDGSGKMQINLRHSGSTPNLDYVDWTYQLPSQSRSVPVSEHLHKRSNIKDSNSTSADDWVQLIAVMDAAQGASIYGGGENTLLVNSVSASTPTITNFGLNGTCSLDGYLNNSTHDLSNSQFIRMQSYRATPPSVSSFSTLSDEGLNNDDNVNKARSSPGNGFDVADLCNLEGQIFGDEGIQGLLVVQPAAGFVGDEWACQ